MGRAHRGADAFFESFDFGEIVKDAGGWQGSAPDVLLRPVFLESGRALLDCAETLR